MATRFEIPTASQKLQLAMQLNEKFDAMCKEAKFLPDTEIMVLALYARTERRERESLFPAGRTC